MFHLHAVYRIESFEHSPIAVLHCFCVIMLFLIRECCIQGTQFAASRRILFIDVLPLGNHFVAYTCQPLFYATSQPWTIRSNSMFYVLAHKMSPVSNDFATMYQLSDVYLVCGMPAPSGEYKMHADLIIGAQHTDTRNTRMASRPASGAHTVFFY